MGDVARSIPKINASLADYQAEYQPTTIEFEGKVFDQTISILIDPRERSNVWDSMLRISSSRITSEIFIFLDFMNMS